MKERGKIACPTCGKRGNWLETRYGPFCSLDCKRRDLAKWLGEEHRISQPLAPGHFEQIEDLPTSPDAAGGESHNE